MRLWNWAEQVKMYWLWFVSSAVQSKQNQHQPAWADWVLSAFWGIEKVVRVTPKRTIPNQKGAVGIVRNRDKTTTLPAPGYPPLGWLGSANTPRTCLRGSVRFPSRTYSIFCKDKHVTHTHIEKNASELTLLWLNPDFPGLGPPSSNYKHRPWRPENSLRLRSLFQVSFSYFYLTHHIHSIDSVAKVWFTILAMLFFFSSGSRVRVSFLKKTLKCKYTIIYLKLSSINKN